jgi:hypothetical protein
MITYNSLQNSRLCLKELRATLHKLPSLQWDGALLAQSQRNFRGETAIVRMLIDISSFIRCSFLAGEKVQSEEVRKSAAFTIEAIEDLVEELNIAFENGMSLRGHRIRRVTSATTKLYQLSRRSNTGRSDCKEYWIKAGLASHAAYR